MPMEPSEKDGLRVNDAIEALKVLLIDGEGQNRGIVSLEEARARAAEAGMDLVEIAPLSSPPVCKILDYGKHKYRAQKRASEAKRKQKVMDIKEIKIRPTIETHDYDVKMRNMRRFFESGDKVKVTMRFRGREMAHPDLGMELMERVKAEIDDVAKVEMEPKLEGNQMTMVLSPR